MSIRDYQDALTLEETLALLPHYEVEALVDKVAELRANAIGDAPLWNVLYGLCIAVDKQKAYNERK